jgi:hypothetical protein
MADPTPIDQSRIAADVDASRIESHVSVLMKDLVQLELNIARRAHDQRIADLKLAHDQTIADLKLDHDDTHWAMMQTTASLQAMLDAKANECKKCIATNRRRNRTIAAMKERTKDFAKTKMKLQRALRARDIAKHGSTLNWKECKIWRKAYPARVQGVYNRVYVARPRPRRLILVAPVTPAAEEAAELFADPVEEEETASEVGAASSKDGRSAEIIEAELYEMLMAHHNDLD